MNINKYSNPKKVFARAKKLGIIIKRSTNPKKKYMTQRPGSRSWIHFGQMGYEDFTKHNDKQRRKNYLKRSGNIRGSWKKDKYSPNNLSRVLLW